MNLLLVLPHDTLLSPQGHRVRFDALLSMLKEHEVHILLPESTPMEDRHFPEAVQLHEFKELQLGSRSIPFFADFQPQFRRRVREVLQGASIDLCLFDFPWGLSSIAKRNAIPCIYFSHGVESEFAAVVAKQFGPLSSLFAWPIRTMIHEIEKRACSASTKIICMSGRDAALLEATYHLAASKTFVMNQPIETHQTPSKQQARDRLKLSQEHTLLIFHGSYSHYPNREAYFLLRDTIAPHLAVKHPEVRILIAGSGMPEHQTENFHSLGFIADLNLFLAAGDLALLPILSGSGVRMKAYDALAIGLPLLATKKAVEGIALVDAESAFLCDSGIEAFQARLDELLRDRQRWQKIGSAGQDYVKRENHPRTISQGLNDMLQTLR